MAIILFLYFLPYQAFSLDILGQESIHEGLINRPALSARCESFIKEKDQLTRVYQRYLGLLNRSDRLLRTSERASPESFLSDRSPPAHDSLEELRRRVGQKAHLIDTKIFNHEYEMVKMGCPLSL